MLPRLVSSTDPSRRSVPSSCPSDDAPASSFHLPFHPRSPVHSPLLLRAASFAAALLLAPLAYSATYYVAASGGNNGNSGGPSAPFATIAHAVSVAASGDTIEILPGTHTIGLPITGVNKQLVFKGAAANPLTTVVKAGYSDGLPQNIGSTTVNPSDGRHIFNLVPGSEGTSFIDIKFDGNNRVAGGAILAESVDGLLVDGCAFERFGARALWLRSGANHIVRYVSFLDCGGETRKSSNGMLSLFDIEDSDFHDITMRSTGEGEGSLGYGIKAGGVTRRCRFFNLDIRIRSFCWFGGNSGQPNFALELHGGTADSVEIFDSYFGNTVSLAHNGVTTAPYAIRFHHNVIHSIAYYAIEAGTQNLQIDHNYSKNGSFARCWYSKHDIRIFANVAENVSSAFFSSSPGFGANQLSPHRNVKIFNNTAFYRASDGSGTRPHNPAFVSYGWKNTATDSTGSTGWEVKNNLVVGAEGSTPQEIANYEVDFFNCDSAVVIPPGIQITHNRLCRGVYDTPGFTFASTNETMGSPGVLLDGAKPNPYYQPMVAQLRDKGTAIPAIPYALYGLDIGAIEYGFNPILDFSFNDGLPSWNPASHVRAFGSAQALPPADRYRAHAILRSGLTPDSAVRSLGTGPKGANDHTFRASTGGMGSGNRNAIVPAEDFPSLVGLKTFTITGWIKPNPGATVGGGVFIAGLIDSDKSYRATVTSQIAGSRRLDLHVNGLPVNSDANFIPDGEVWTFFAVTYNGDLTSGNVKFYKGDATTAVSSPISASLNAGAISGSAPAWYMGNNYDRNRAFGGQINSVAIYPTVLTQIEIDAVRKLWK